MKNYKKLGIIKSKGRLINEAISAYRSPFQRDRDRIIHSTAFRRLKHKTQVFVNTEGDHYRTRITHSIEVAQIARTISRYLNLNDDLTETLSLAHDLGHTPFGHAGENALNECMINHDGFDHNLQTLRIVMFIENKYVKFKGLNLTLETLDGLLKHNGPYYDSANVENLIGIKKLKNKIDLKTYPSLEAQIVSISDDIAYNNHDIQDGYSANLFKLNDLKEISFFNDILKKYSTRTKKIDNRILIYQMVRDSINLMVKDLIKNSLINIKVNKIKKLNDIYKSENKLVCFSNHYENIIDEVRYFLSSKMYKNNKVLNKNNEGKRIIEKLFKVISRNPRKFLTFLPIKHNKYRSVADYISGMTDRFAINIYKSIK
jgi:dGTPase